MPAVPSTTTEGPRGGDRRADVVVVGAGPAGSSAAWHLARAGLDVVVLEKARLPREKVCGDGLTPRGVKARLPAGRYLISVRARDAARNVERPRSFTAKVR